MFSLYVALICATCVMHLTCHLDVNTLISMAIVGSPFLSSPNFFLSMEKPSSLSSGPTIATWWRWLPVLLNSAHPRDFPMGLSQMCRFKCPQSLFSDCPAPGPRPRPSLKHLLKPWILLTSHIFLLFNSLPNVGLERKSFDKIVLQSDCRFFF